MVSIVVIFFLEVVLISIKISIKTEETMHRLHEISILVLILNVILVNPGQSISAFCCN